MNTNQDTMLTNHDETEAKDLAFSSGYKAGYKSATKASEQRIQELEGDVRDLNQLVNIRCGQIQERDSKIVELQAHINQLREVLQSSLNDVEKFKDKWIKVPAFGYKVNKSVREGISHAHGYIFLAFNKIQNSIAATPAQSLVEHDNALIDRCKNIVADDALAITFQSMGAYRSEIIRQIGALKASS